MAVEIFPPPESDGGWRVADPRALGVDAERLRDAVEYHDRSALSYTRGGALVVVHRGRIVAESYVTGEEGGPQPWARDTCNDVKSSTKSVFGTAVGAFLDEYKDRVNLDTPLVGASRGDSLIPQIWDQPLTDERKRLIRVRHVLSMTSGSETREPWLAPSVRHHYMGYRGAYQLYEYCFGWWFFDGVPSQHRLLFEPGRGFNYSNYGLEMMALAMRNLTGLEVCAYAYDRVLGPIGMPVGVRDNRYREMPYADENELNYSDEPGWGRGGGTGCNAYGADRGPSPYGHNTVVGSTFRCSARDFARLGYLWLRKGRWGDRQLVPAEWMKKATSRYVQDTGDSANYGYTFWVADDWEGVPRDAFMSRGHNVNHCCVVPSLDLVVARQGNENGSAEERSLFMKTLVQRIVAAMPEAK